MTGKTVPERQPTMEEEEANAAYVWRRQVQHDLATIVSDLTSEFELVAWHFERYRRACERFTQLEALAKHKNKSSERAN